MYSRQNCPKCHRWMCFFCNENWDSSTMRNQQYTCGLSTCTYQQYLTFEMVASSIYNGDLGMPNIRCCPKCGTLVVYGDHSKFNECANCHYWFCFLCLKSQIECGTPWNQKCVKTPVLQTYTVFPRIGS
jgi:ribosomal protein S27AE